jgi:hypothetical protein
MGEQVLLLVSCQSREFAKEVETGDARQCSPVALGMGTANYSGA